MSLKEAAQKALEALTEIDSPLLVREITKIGKAMSGLRAALAEDAMQRLTDEQQMIERGNEPVTNCHGKGGDKLSSPLDALGMVATSQESRQVEPVAWMVYTLDGQSAFITDKPADFTPEHRALPLYTSPPTREPLTDEQIYCAIKNIDSLRAVNVARAVERAHGIGGEE